MPPPRHVPFLDLPLQHRLLRQALAAAWDQALDRSDFILGQATEQFEADFARYLGTDHVVGVGNGLDALRLALTALEIGPGHEVLVPANTFIATALAVTAVGARPVLVDCDPQTYCLAPEQIERSLTPRTRAVIPVHFAGRPAEMDALGVLAERHRLAIVEDVAQAAGAQYQGRRCGTLGAAGCFSFYPGKNLGACGDGGALATADAALAHRVRQLRNYGQEVKYVHRLRGVNSRLDTVQAAVLHVKLPHLDAWNEQRRRLAERYREQLGGVGDLAFPTAAATHVYHLFVIETDQRDALQRSLAEAGIQTLVHYPVPIHLQDAYRDLGYRVGDFPVTERLAQRSLSLPLYPELSDAQQAYVVECIRTFFASG